MTRREDAKIRVLIVNVFAENDAGELFKCTLIPSTFVT